MTVAKQVRRLSSLKRATYDIQTAGADFEPKLERSKNALANELEQLGAKFSERDTALARAKQVIEYLAERGAQLEHQGALACAPPILEERLEEQAAQSVTAEKRVVELEGELGAARKRLVLQENENHSLQTSLNLIVSENSRLWHRLSESEAAVDETNEKHRTEIDTLKSRLESMSLRAVAAEKSLVEVRKSLTVHIDDERATDRKVVDGIRVRNAVDKKLGQLWNSLRIKLPVELVAKLDIDAELVDDQGANKQRPNCADRQCELDSDVDHNDEYSERDGVRYTQLLLASVLTS